MDNVLGYCYHTNSHLLRYNLKAQVKSYITEREGHCHLTYPLSLQANSPLAKGDFPGLRLLGIGARKFNVESEVWEK
jgi:hypothetical protein